jgi:hypothetical protein
MDGYTLLGSKHFVKQSIFHLSCILLKNTNAVVKKWVEEYVSLAFATTSPITATTRIIQLLFTI